MNAEREPDDIDSSRQSGDSSSPLRHDDDILFDRLRNEPPLKAQAPLSLTLGIVAGALALGVILYFAFRKPDTFVSDAPKLSEHQQQHSADQALETKRSHLAPLIDSLEKAAKTADSPETELALANAYYDGEFWSKALAMYEHYLEHVPNNINARIDYAFSITQVSGDYPRAISEIEKALAIEPEHVQGLFNAGILSLRANMGDKQAALSSARAYFTRAKAAATKQGNTQMSSQITEILKEMDLVAKDSTAAR